MSRNKTPGIGTHDVVGWKIDEGKLIVIIKDGARVSYTPQQIKDHDLCLITGVTMRLDINLHGANLWLPACERRRIETQLLAPVPVPSMSQDS